MVLNTIWLINLKNFIPAISLHIKEVTLLSHWIVLVGLVLDIYGRIGNKDDGQFSSFFNFTVITSSRAETFITSIRLRIDFTAIHMIHLSCWHLIQEIILSLRSHMCYWFDKSVTLIEDDIHIAKFIICFNLPYYLNTHTHWVSSRSVQ